MAKSHRLTHLVKPSKYKLTIKPNLADFSFTGSEVISIDVAKLTNSLTLHAADIKVLSAVIKVGKDSRKVKKISYQPKAETVTFFFAKSFIGKVVLSLEFSGSINSQLRGFYRSRYLHKKEEKHLAVTQFEATDARRAFPCFDEPAHKAIFELSVIIPKNLKVISNTVEKDIRAHEAGLKIVNFEPTPKMSTYLLALIVGEFEHLSGKTKRGVQIRVHTTPGKKAQGRFALDTTKRALEFLEDYFDIPFPMPVLDMIAIPDFSAGAMENWGAVTFRETALLVDEEHTSILAKQRVAEVIAHELAHQWFGNLVTMEWWTHLWLNESFATYMAYLVTNELFPDWNYWTKFVLDEQSTALYADVLKVTQPVEVEVKHPDEINEQFDPAIVYAKGASILRMLASYVGPEAFRTGLQIYLKKHSYKNTSSIHLWEAFEQATKLPVVKFMKTWSTKQGYPVIDARLDGDKLVLKQEKFSLLPNKDKTTWDIPILSSVVTGKGSLATQSAQYKLRPDFEFIKLNEQEPGYYLVNYSMSLLARLLPELQGKKLRSVDRLAIIRNSLLLARGGYLSSDVFLEILNYIKDDRSYIVWAEVHSGLEQLTRMVAGTKAEPKLTSYKKELFGELITQLGFIEKKQEIESITTLRALALLEAGLSGHKQTVIEAKNYFKKKLKGKHIPAELRLGIYSTVAKHGDKATFLQLKKIYTNSHNPQEKQQILFAFTRFTQVTVQKLVVEFLLSSEVRGQDRPFILSYCLGQPDFKETAWRGISEHWEQLFEEFSGSKLLGRILSGAKGFNNAQDLRRFEQFIKAHKVAGAKLVVAKTLEQIRANIAWQKRDLSLINKYLA